MIIEDFNKKNKITLSYDTSRFIKIQRTILNFQFQSY